MVQSMFQASNLTINQQANPNLYEPSSFYSNQHHSPSHAQFLQVSLFTSTAKNLSQTHHYALADLLPVLFAMKESLIHSQFQDPVSNGNQLKQVSLAARTRSDFCL